MNLNHLKSLLVGAALAGLSFCVMPTSVHAQTTQPPSVSLPAGENLAQIISTVQVYQMMIDDGWTANNLADNETLGYIHGLIEFISDGEGVAGYDGRIDPPFYDDIPFTQANEQEYLNLASGYYASAAYLNGVGQTSAALAFAYDAGFFQAIADQIAGKPL